MDIDDGELRFRDSFCYTDVEKDDAIGFLLELIKSAQSKYIYLNFILICLLMIISK